MSTSNVGTGVSPTDPTKVKSNLAAANGIIGALGPATEQSFNGLKYTQMGLSAGTLTGNPYVAAIGAAGGFVADSITAKQNRRDQQNEVIKQNTDIAGQLEAFSPYRGGGFNQVNEGWFSNPTQMNVGAPRYADGGPIDPPKKGYDDARNAGYSHAEAISLLRRIDVTRMVPSPPPPRASAQMMQVRDPARDELPMAPTGREVSSIGAPLDPMFYNTELGISPMRMAASDALAQQLQEQRTRERPVLPNWSTKMDADGNYLLSDGIAHPGGHDGRARKGNYQGMPSGPPTDLNRSTLNESGSLTRRGRGNSLYNYADGGATPLGHIIPVEKVHQALADADAASADVSGGIVPGAGGPKADNVQMTPPGGQPINVSSGELFVGNDVFGAMAQSAGLSPQEYAARMYPNAQGGQNMAYGGEVDGDPKVVKSSNLTGENYRRQIALGMPAAGVPKTITSALPGDAVNVADFSLKSAAPPSGGTNAGEARPITMGRTDPSTTAGLKTAPDKGIGDTSNDLYGNSPDYDKMHRQNQGAGFAQLGLVSAAALYNATQQRRATSPPASFQPNKLDLQTGALRAGLDADRSRGLATGIYNTRDQQGIGRNLGLVAADLEARRRNAMTVEDVENREREVNTQISNTAGLYNNQQMTRFNENETARANEFRQMKGENLTADLASASGVIGSMANNGISIEAMRSSEELQRRYLMFLSGAQGTRSWTGEEVLGQPRV